MTAQNNRLGIALMIATVAVLYRAGRLSPGILRANTTS
jgi:hypothetical protein